jgi:hypothetical protein
MKRMGDCGADLSCWGQGLFWALHWIWIICKKKGILWEAVWPQASQNWLFAKLSDISEPHIACRNKNTFQAKGTNRYIYIWFNLKTCCIHQQTEWAKLVFQICREINDNINVTWTWSVITGQFALRQTKHSVPPISCPVHHSCILPIVSLYPFPLSLHFFSFLRFVLFYTRLDFIFLLYFQD